MYQYFKRQLKTPTCFGTSGIHPLGVLKVLHWNYLWCFVCTQNITSNFSDSTICCLCTTVSSWRWALEARNM